MNWFTEHLPHIAAGLASGAAMGAIDHYIKKAQELIPENAWELLKALVTRRPIRAITATATAAAQKQEGVFAMSINLDLSDLEKGIEKLEALGARLATAVAAVAKAAEGLATIAAAAAPLTGSAAPAVKAGAELAEGLAPVIEKEAGAIASQQGNAEAPQTVANAN